MDCASTHPCHELAKLLDSCSRLRNHLRGGLLVLSLQLGNLCLVTWQRLFCRDLVRRPRPVAPGVSQAPGRPSECLRSAGSARVVARNVLAVRRLFVSAKTETNTKSAQVRICRPIGSTSAHPGRKNTTASASTPETAGLSASALPIEAFQTLIAMPSRKRRLRFGLAAPPVRRSDFLRPPNLLRAGPLDS